MKKEVFPAVLTGAMAAVFLIGSAADNSFAREKMEEPRVEYSADMVITAENEATSYKIYHALGGKQRQEMNFEGTSQAVITRPDKKVSWVLMPEQKMYMETGFEQASEQMAQGSQPPDMSECAMDATPAGSESINGVQATRSKISMSCPNNFKYDGDMWVTKEGIMVKMDATTVADGHRSRFQTELKNLKVGKQNPALFEIPAGYEKLSPAGMGSMMPQGAFSRGETARPSPEPSSSGMEDANAEIPSGGRDYTSQARPTRSLDQGPPQQMSSGRDYTSRSSQQETGASPSPNDQLNNILDTAGKIRGLFGR